MDSICTNDRQAWHTIQKELEDIGITAAAFDANKAFIFEWFINAISSGAFEERSWDDSLTTRPSLEQVSRGTLISLLANTWFSMV